MIVHGLKIILGIKLLVSEIVNGLSKLTENQLKSNLLYSATNYNSWICWHAIVQQFTSLNI